MDSVRILHCADFHLGVERVSLGNKSKARRAEVRRTFLTVTELAKSEKVDLLLIAGDLFDCVNVPEELVCMVRDTFAAMAPMQIAMVSGNHDPATPDSVYLREDFWPDNVLIFSTAMQVAELHEIGVRLLGAGFMGTYCNSPLFRRVTLPKDDLINIGIMHGDVVADGAGSEYNPIPLRNIEGSGLSYLALGHRHTRSLPITVGNTTYAYCGCPEGQRFGENGEQGVYICDVTSDYADVRFVPVCKRHYTEIDLNVEAVESIAELKNKIQERMEAVNGEAYADDIYRVNLLGSVEPDFSGVADKLAEELPDIWYLEIRDKTTPLIDEAVYMQENSLRGCFVKKMSELKDTVPENRRELALKLGLQAFHGEIPLD